MNWSSANYSETDRFAFRLSIWMPDVDAFDDAVRLVSCAPTVEQVLGVRSVSTDFEDVVTGSSSDDNPGNKIPKRRTTI